MVKENQIPKYKNKGNCYNPKPREKYINKGHQDSNQQSQIRQHLNRENNLTKILRT